MAHTSTTSTLPSMTALPTALTAERDAGAAWRVLAEQAHLAAANMVHYGIVFRKAMFDGTRFVPSHETMSSVPAKRVEINPILVIQTFSVTYI